MDLPEIERDLVSMQSFDAISNVLDGIVLHPIQCIDVMKMLYQKRAIVSYDTGTGKTLLAAAVMQLLWREDFKRRFLFFCLKDQLQQTPKKLETLTGRPAIFTAADAESIRYFLQGKRFLGYPVVMMTHECLRNHALMKGLWEEREEFVGVFIDEAHLLNNKYFAQSAEVVAGIASKLEYCYALTATPFTTDVGQMSRLVSVVDGKRYPDHVRLARRIVNGSFSIEEDPLFFINRSGEELGRDSCYVGRILWVDAMGHQTKDLGGHSLMALCKGEGAVAQAEALTRLCKEYGGKRGLIYVNQHSVRGWILPFFDRAGISYRCINGGTKAKERAVIMEEFNVEKSVDVIITSVTAAVDLDCDYVVFYEFTADLKQMIGRADRGLAGKVVDVWYVLTRGSNEPGYFMEHIVERSGMTKQILGKKITEIETVMGELSGRVG